MERNTRRSWVIVGALVTAVTACGPGESAIGGEGSATEASLQPVTYVDQSKVERQSIGNCWLYAGASWVESLNKAATGEELNTSESYVTYWHWFDQIARGGSSIRTGGSYGTVVDLYTRYGLMLQGAFVPEEATDEMSHRQAEALNAINESLKNGALSTSAARRNRVTVRAELDRAWNLNSDTRALLDAVFGPGVSKTLDKAYATQVPPSVEATSGTLRVLRPVDVAARVRSRESGNSFEVKTLADVIGGGYWRSGPYAWQEVDYPYSLSDRREVQKRVQRALNDHQPVIVSWFVDFNALARDSTFTVEELKRRGGPGRQGGHMVVMHDYEVDNVPGYGTLKAGVEETRPEALSATLASEATVRFFRVKNSWGAYRPDRWDVSDFPGYHDLFVTYLDGPIQQCGQDEHGNTNPNSCWSTTPLRDLVLPAGY